MSMQELRTGVHFAFGDSKMTQLSKGVFIEYDGVWTDRMQELKDFLIKYYHIGPEDSRYLFEDHIPYAEGLAHCLKLLGRPAGIQAKGQGTD